MSQDLVGTLQRVLPHGVSEFNDYQNVYYKHIEYRFPGHFPRRRIAIVFQTYICNYTRVVN